MKKTFITMLFAFATALILTKGCFCGEVPMNEDDNESKTNSWYWSEGTWFTRCVYDPAEKKYHAAEQQIYVDHEELHGGGYHSVVIDGTIYTDYVTDWELILSKIYAKGYTEWAHEIEGALDGTGGAVYVRWDHVMRVQSKGKVLPFIYLNTFSAGIDVNPDYMYNFLKKLGWPHASDCIDHFNQYILIGGRGEDVPTELIQEALGNTKISHEDTGEPKYKYSHDSVDGYDLTEGIPSGKSLSYRWQSESWYGNTDVWQRTVTTTKYRNIPYQVNYTYTWTEVVHHKDLIFENGAPKKNPDGSYAYNEWDEDIDHTETRKITGTFDEIRNGDTETLVPAVAYQYLVNANFYDFEQLQAFNASYAGDLYGNSIREVPMKCVSTANYIEISGSAGKDQITSWYADDAKHISWANIDMSKRIYNIDVGNMGKTTSQNAANSARIKAIAARDAWYTPERKKIKDAIYDGTITRNDVLSIDGTDYLKAYNDKGVNFTEDGRIPASNNFCTESAACKMPFKPGSITGAARPMESGNGGTYIPQNTDNGKYPTLVKSMYVRKIRNDMSVEDYKADSGGEYHAPERIANGHSFHSGRLADEYVNVHTPVIAPTIIRNSSGSDIMANGLADTQMPGTLYKSGAVQLILDNVYVIDWEEAIHRIIALYGDSGDESKYDEFVEAKYVKFPFDVYYNGKFYDATMSENDGTGVLYTDWIRLAAPAEWNTPNDIEYASAANNYYPKSHNHWQKAPFYIPSYAIECGSPGKEANILYKVEAYNVDGRYGGNHAAQQEAIFNKNYTYALSPDAAKYVATYKIACQLSGQIYDFLICGDSDTDTFAYEDTGTGMGVFNVPFCTYKEEKRVGTLNRLGGDGVRFRTDGSITTNWNVRDTIPLSLGKSSSFENMGYMIKGSMFSFSLKTISNLWSEQANLKIYPEFRYINANTGQESTNLKVYYESPFTGEKFIEMGSEKDKANENRMTTSLSNTQFNDSYYDSLNTWEKQIGNWIKHTVDYHNDLTGDDFTEQGFLLRSVPTSCLGYINLSSKVKLLSGEYEQSFFNTAGHAKEFESILTYDNMGSNFNRHNDFMKSMQTWYGTYYIPSKIYIVDLDDPDTRKAIEDVGLDPDNFDITDYMYEEGGIRGDEDIFSPSDEGYLVINFDIHAYDGNEEKLIYGGGGNASIDMWKKEGQEDNTKAKDGSNIPLKSGDVAVVDLSQSMSDKFKAGIYTIN